MRSSSKSEIFRTTSRRERSNTDWRGLQVWLKYIFILLQRQKLGNLDSSDTPMIPCLVEKLTELTKAISSLNYAANCKR